MKHILLVFLALLSPMSMAQNKPGAVSLKMLGTEAMDASVRFGVSRKSFSYSLGYGTLLGSKAFNPNAQGYSGSGLNFSNFSTLNSSWLGLRTPLAAGQSLQGNSWGKNGINVTLEGLVGNSVTYGAAYSGQNNTGAFYFGTPDKQSALLGNSLISGKGFILTKENKIDSSRVDLEIKF